MDPISLAALGLSVAGSLFKGFQQSQAGMAAAEIARFNGDVASARGLQKENAVRENVDTTIRNATAHFAAAGIDPSFGSPLLMAARSAAQGEIDARIVRADTTIARANAVTEAADARKQATADRFAGFFGAGTAALSGLAKAWPGMPAARPTVGTGGMGVPRYGVGGLY